MYYNYGREAISNFKQQGWPSKFLLQLLAINLLLLFQIKPFQWRIKYFSGTYVSSTESLISAQDLFLCSCHT